MTSSTKYHLLTQIIQCCKGVAKFCLMKHLHRLRYKITILQQFGMIEQLDFFRVDADAISII